MRSLLGNYQSSADELIHVLDDLHHTSTFRPLVEAAVKNHPLQLQTVAQAKAAESGSSVSDARALAAQRQKRGRPPKGKGAKKAASKEPHRKSQRISGKGDKGKGGKTLASAPSASAPSASASAPSASAPSAPAPSASSASAPSASVEPSAPPSSEPPSEPPASGQPSEPGFLKSALAEILAREGRASAAAAGSAGSEQLARELETERKRAAGLDKVVQEQAAELKLYELEPLTPSNSD